MTFIASLSEIIEKNENGLLGLSPSWERVLLAEIAEVLNGYAFPSAKFTKDVGKPLLRIRDILHDKTETRFNGNFDPIYLVKKNELIIVMDGDFNCSLWQGEESLLNQRVCKVTPDERFYNRTFLSYVLPGYLSAINSYTSSLTVKHLSSSTTTSLRNVM